MVRIADRFVPSNRHHHLNGSRLLRVREIVSTHVATEALPFDRVPPSIAIPDCVFVKRQNTGRIGWYCCHDIKPSSRSCP
jgi:hypothetical protein